MSNRENLLGTLEVKVHFDPAEFFDPDAAAEAFDSIDWQALVTEAIDVAGIDIDKVDISVVEG